MDTNPDGAADRVVRTALVPGSRRKTRIGRHLVLLNGALLTGALLLAFTVQSSASTLRVGDVAGETVIAQHRQVYTDHLATAAHARQAMNAVVTQYQYDPHPAMQRAWIVSRYLSKVSSIVTGTRSPEARVRAIMNALPRTMPRPALQTFLSLTSADLNVVRPYTDQLLTQAVAWRFDVSELQTTAIALLSTIPARVSLPQRTAIGELVAAFLVPTNQPNRAATARLQKQASARTLGVRSTIVAGQVIVRRGDVVTASTMQQLEALGLQSRKPGWHESLGTLLYAALVVTTLFWYFRAFQPSILENARILLLIDLSMLASVIAARLLAPGHVLLPFFLPVAGASTFAAVLIAPEAAVALALSMALAAGWIVANSFELTIYYFLSGAAGVLAIRQATRIKQFAVAGMAIGIFSFLAALSFAFVDHTYDFAAIQDYLLAAAFNGSVSATLALGGFALLSSYFGVTTTLQLLELAQPNQPLLRRLTVKAPGTYNHSLIVSNMVESAAEDIGANSLVAKVGALYHDVGKTANPHCFVENQMGMANIHDELRPAESARIIRGHVPQGLRLARQHRLPRVILDHIAEHHGTMTLSYFLHKERQESEGIAVNASLYAYPGPRPHSRETALLMLADGCESAVRASPDHSQDRIRGIVDAIFRERIDQGQLNECPLTIRDLELIKQAFRSVLNGLYHPRIEYPDTQAVPPSQPHFETELEPTAIISNVQ